MDEAPPPARRNSVWLLVSTVLCCTLVGVVIALALNGQAETEPEEPWQTDPLRDPKHAFVPPPGPRNPCGALDPDNPAAMTVKAGKDGLDFGPVRQSATAELEFDVVSSGKGPLCIYNWKSGCGCFKVSLKDPKKKMLQPGERTTFVVTMDSTGKMGRVRKRISIYTNSLDRPIERIPCRVDVSRGLIANRRTLGFAPVPTNTPSRSTLVLHAPLDEPDWTVTKVVGTRKLDDGKLVNYSFELHDIRDHRFRKRSLVVTHPGMSKVGRWAENVVVHTTHPDRPQITLQAYSTVVNRILTRARRVTLGHVHAGKASKPAKVRFQPGSPEIEFSLTRAYVAPKPGATAASGFLAKVGRDEKGWFVDVHYDGRARAAGLLEGELVVKTSDGAQPQIRLPVHATLVDDK